MYSGGSGLSVDIHFVDLELSYDVLSPLPIVLSKHFNHLMICGCNISLSCGEMKTEQALEILDLASFLHRDRYHDLSN